jgi:plasmid stabilization system protein ParE
MTAEVRWSARAARDVVACALWWVSHHSQNVEAFDNELETSLTLIREFPESSPRGRLKTYKTARVRVMAETGHLLVYRVKSRSEVEIVAVLASRKTATRP